MSFQRPTPRTDALILSNSGFGLTDYQWRNHARALERECDEMRQAIKEFYDLAHWLAANSSGLPYRTANAIVTRSRPFLAKCGQYADKHITPASPSTPDDTLEPLQNQAFGSGEPGRDRTGDHLIKS